MCFCSIFKCTDQPAKLSRSDRDRFLITGRSSQKIRVLAEFIDRNDAFPVSEVEKCDQLFSQMVSSDPENAVILRVNNPDVRLPVKDAM